MNARPPQDTVIQNVLAAARALSVALALVLATASTASASGSVEVTVATKSYTVSVAQTFRKMLMPGDTTYYPRVRANFRGIIHRLDPALRAFIEGRAAKRVKALGQGGLALPVLRCTSADCPDATTLTTPTLVMLKPLSPASDSRTAYTFALPMKAAPTLVDIQWLRAELQRVLDSPSKTVATGKLKTAKLTPVVMTGRSSEVRVTSTALVHARDAAWFQERLRDFAKAQSAALSPVLRKFDGITFGRIKTGLKPYDGRGTMPASLVLERRSGQRYTLIASVALQAVEEGSEGEAAIKALRQAMQDAIPR